MGDWGELLGEIIMAAFAAVGLEEWLKNFLPKNRKLGAAIMLPLAAGCFFAARHLPTAAIGSALTVGSVQLCYETLIQGFRALVERAQGKIRDEAGKAPPKDKEGKNALQAESGQNFRR